MEIYIIVTFFTFIITAMLGMFILPILRKLKVGQTIRDDGPQTHLKKQGTPTMGGIIIEISIIIGTTLIYLYLAKGNNQIQRIFPLLLVTTGFGLIGFIDDFKKLVLKDTKGLKPSYKMIGLLVISVAYVLYLTQIIKNGTELLIPFLNQQIILPIWIYIPFAIFILLGTTNAVNLTDGIDGLSSTVVTVIITFFMVVGIQLGLMEVSMFASILIGACLGFLIFNLHPAKMFMGDTGALLLGRKYISNRFIF